MSDVVIKVENLSKKYILSHERPERYTALRDVMASGAKRIGNKVFSLFASHISYLSESREDFYALRDINFEVKQGDRLGIIGRNGAGKSTLLKLLSRITEPTNGRIEITGRVASLLEVGTGFHPELTGRENIFLNGAVLGMGKAEIRRKFDEIVYFAEVEQFLDTPVKRYSSGMYVRLAFAVAAHLEPEILIVDEVLAVGDAQFQKKCLGKMEDVAKEGRTVLFVSHNMGAIQRLCTSCILLKNGRLADKGWPEDVVKRYLTQDAATSGTVDISNIPRMSGLGRDGRISALNIYNSAFEPTTSLAFGESFTIEVICKIFRSMKGVSFLVGIDSVLEERIATITSFEVERTFDGQPGYIYKGRLTVKELLLKPGAYNLSVGLFAIGYGIDSVPGAGRLEITSASKEFTNVGQVTVGYLQLQNPHWEIQIVKEKQ